MIVNARESGEWKHIGSGGKYLYMTNYLLLVERFSFSYLNLILGTREVQVFDADFDSVICGSPTGYMPGAGGFINCKWASSGGD